MDNYLNKDGLSTYHEGIKEMFDKYGIEVEDITSKSFIPVRQIDGIDLYFVDTINTNIPFNNDTCMCLPDEIDSCSTGVIIFDQCTIITNNEVQTIINKYIISDGENLFTGSINKENDIIISNTGWTKSLSDNDFVEISKEDFEALPLSIRNNGKTYFITSSNGESIELYLKTETFEAFQAKYNNDLNLINTTLNTMQGNTGSIIDVTLDSTTYILTINLKNKNGDILSSKSVDFPMEMAFVNASYDKESKSIVFELQNGVSVIVPIGDLINGLVSKTEFDSYKEEVTTEIDTKINAIKIGGVNLLRNSKSLEGYSLDEY